MQPTGYSSTAEGIYILYKDFCDSLPKGTIAREFTNSILSEIDRTGGASRLTGLKVDLTLDQIKEIYEKYHVIQLRDVIASKSLLVGCGNSPITDVICKGDGHNHTHEEYVTVDPSILMNPTLIGAFGVQESLHDFLPKRFYVKLVTEASSVVQKADDACKNMLECMASDFKSYAMDIRGELKEENYTASSLFNENSWLY